MTKKIVDWDGSRIRALNYIVNGRLKFEFDAFKFCIGATCLVFADNKEAYMAFMYAASYCPNFKEIAKLGANAFNDVLEAMQCESYTLMVTDGSSITFATLYLVGDNRIADITDMPMGSVIWLVPEYNNGKLKYREVTLNTQKIM
ncbi:MAG: hypothetical protein QXI07_11555, partial [Pyrobaculum sp.]